MPADEGVGRATTISAVSDSYRVQPVTEPINAVVRPPGSKSETNRALVLGSLASGGVSRLWGPLEAEDSLAMRRSLRQFGVMIDDNDDPWLVLGTGGSLDAPAGTVDVGASGTTARFMTAVAALVHEPVELDGTERMRERPIGDLTDALARLGARVETAGRTPPVRIVGGGLSGGRVSIDGSRSSQFVSALLMIAPMLEGALDIDVVGDRVSERYVEATVDMMRRFGAEVEVTAGGYSVAPTGYRKSHVEIEADASAAVYPSVAAAVTGGEICIEGIPPGSNQPDLLVLKALEQMGCRVRHTDARIEIRGPEHGLSPIDIDMEMAPDGSLGLAVACLFADGPSVIRGLSTLRLKETDRLAALATEIDKLGATATIAGDSLSIVPGSLSGCHISTYDDHRMAMSFALVGLVIDGVEIDDPACVNKTWPDYFTMLEHISG